MIALILSPVARWIAGLVAILAIIASIYAKGRIDGRASVVQKIEASNRKAGDKADAAERCVLAGRWNKEAGRCED